MVHTRKANLLEWAAKVLLVCLFAFPAIAQVTAQSYIVIAQDGRVLAEHDADTLRPLASITKLVSLSLVRPGFDEVTITLEERDTIKGTRMRLRPGSYVQHDLLEAALINSNNEAAKAVGRSIPNLIADVNKLNADRGFNLNIVEPSGLDPNNIGTARALAKLLWVIKDEPTAHISIEPTTKHGKTTNAFLGRPGWEFQVSKTGYIKEAGGCLVTMVKIGGEWVAVAILGSTSVRERWRDLARIRKQLAPTDDFYDPGKVKEKAKRKRR